MLTLPPLALYIHLPWCIRKCPYCDFNSHTLRDELPEKVYIDKLLMDLEHDYPSVKGRPLVSLFIGGGTPSLFSPMAIERLLTAIDDRFHLAKDIEITLEANPGTVDFERFAGYRAAGVNRLSIGIQSFQADKLQVLGRIHNAGEAIRSLETARAAGFENFNCDLMFGLPQQILADALFDLNTAIALNPSHLSWYQLTIEPNTFFAHKPPRLPQDENIWEMQEQGQELLAKNGYIQYEISAYSQADKSCQHNKNYWEFGDYLGIGAGAHAKLTDTINQTIYRTWKIKNPRDYLNAQSSFIGEQQKVISNELPFEFMLNALRLYQPIPVSLFEERTGLPISSMSKPLNQAQQKGLIEWDNQVITTTDLGKRFYNDLVEMFIHSSMRE